jgi:50S ribosomal protein L16 3-hydroxylase
MPVRAAKPAPASANAPPAAAHAAAAALLGGRSAADFLAQHWQKDALLVRGAMPGSSGPFTVAQLFRLARRDDVESRLVVREGARWMLRHGPFRHADFKALPARNWTLLVQGANLHSDAADALLRRFSFLPYARLDDVMVSYAAPGGGLGPHVDSYDVFLLQGFGRRRWRHGRQVDCALRPGLPLKILRRFTPTHDAVLAPGDMLYLPPHHAHEGTALDACTTYSIGFRAPSANDLAIAFLDDLRDRLDVPGRYADPDIAPTREPARIDRAMQRNLARLLVPLRAQLRGDAATIARFFGAFLSEPKPHVFFTPPAPPLARPAFVRRATLYGIHLDRRTQLLYDDRYLYINGTALRWPAVGAATIRRLGDARALSAREANALAAPVATLLHDWYRDGFLRPDDD